MPSLEQVTLLDYCRAIWRFRWVVLASLLISTLIAFAVGRLQPKIYVATATMLQPRETGPTPIAASLGSLLGGSEGRGGLSVPGLSLSMRSVTTAQDVYVARLKSRTMGEIVLEALEKQWGAGVREMVGKAEPNTQEKGVIGLTVQARDPKLAADAANEFLVQLDRMLERSAQESVKRQEVFYLAQLERAAKEVEDAEKALMKFQTENRYLAVDASAKAGAQASGGLRGSIMALELQREVMRMRYTDQHPDMRDLDKRIAELKRQYSQNLYGTAMDLPPETAAAGRGRREFFVPAARMTPVQFAFVKLYQNLQIQQAFYSGAVQGLSQLKYRTGADWPTVEVLDPAIPPGTHVRPNLQLIVGAGAVAGLVLGVFLALFLEYLARLRAVAAVGSGAAQVVSTARGASPTPGY